MKKAIRFTMLSLVLVSVLPLAEAAGPTKAKPVMCPVCHMPLSKTKTKADPVAVKLSKNSPIMYCCAKCKMPAKVLVKPGPKPKSSSKVK